jgi:hypothetical protein
LSSGCSPVSQRGAAFFAQLVAQLLVRLRRSLLKKVALRWQRTSLSSALQQKFPSVKMFCHPAF